MTKLLHPTSLIFINKLSQKTLDAIMWVPMLYHYDATIEYFPLMNTHLTAKDLIWIRILHRSKDLDTVYMYITNYFIRFGLARCTDLIVDCSVCLIWTHWFWLLIFTFEKGLTAGVTIESGCLLLLATWSHCSLYISLGSSVAYRLPNQIIVMRRF
jgi:hypothetical protein